MQLIQSIANYGACFSGKIDLTSPNNPQTLDISSYIEGIVAWEAANFNFNGLHGPTGN